MTAAPDLLQVCNAMLAYAQFMPEGLVTRAEETIARAENDLSRTVTKEKK